jgi:hypothetical protein
MLSKKPPRPISTAGVLVPAPGIGSFRRLRRPHYEQTKALTTGQTYFNVHAVASPGGEVRGQVVKAP